MKNSSLNPIRPDRLPSDDLLPYLNFEPRDDLLTAIREHTANPAPTAKSTRPPDVQKTIDLIAEHVWAFAQELVPLRIDPNAGAIVNDLRVTRRFAHAARGNNLADRLTHDFLSEYVPVNVFSCRFCKGPLKPPPGVSRIRDGEHSVALGSGWYCPALFLPATARVLLERLREAVAVVPIAAGEHSPQPHFGSGNDRFALVLFVNWPA